MQFLKNKAHFITSNKFINFSRMILSLRLYNLFSRAVKTFVSPQHHRNRYYDMKVHLENQRFQETDNIMNKLDDQIDRQNSIQYGRYLYNKIIIQFNLRKYGHSNLAIKNALNYLSKIEQSPYTISSMILLKQLGLQFLYQREKQASTRNLIWQRSKHLTLPASRIRIAYFNAMSYINQGIISKGVNQLLLIINDQTYKSFFEQSDTRIIKFYQSLAFIAIITTRIMFTEKKKQILSKENDMAIKLVKDYINKGKIDQQQLFSSNPFLIYDQYNQYQQLFPAETQVYKFNCYKLDALIGEQLLVLKDFNGLYKQLQKVKGTIFEPWLKAKKFLDQGQFDEAMSQFQKTAQHQFSQPEYDILKYEAIKYAGELGKKLNVEDAEGRLEEAELFRLQMRLETGTQHLPYLVLPFNDILGLQGLDL